MRLKHFVLLASIQAWLGIIFYFLLPVDPKNQLILGFSVFRLIFIAILLMIGLAGWLFYFFNFYHLSEKFQQKIQTNPLPFIRLESVLEFFFIIGLLFCLLPLLKPIPGITQEFHQRILPLLSWFTLVCFESAFFLVFLIAQQEKKGVLSYYCQKLLGTQNEISVGDYNPKYSLGLSLLLLMTFLLPSTNAALFSGIPISNWVDGIALLIILPLILDNKLRSVWVTKLTGLHRSLKWVLPLMLGLVLVLKMVVFLGGVDRGFLGCYRVLGQVPQNGLCELSFENPTFRSQVTRVDKSLSFDQNSWNLTYFNTIKYGEYGDDGSIERKRLPFQVVWNGNSSFDPGDSLNIEYTGCAVLHIGDKSLTLEPAYYDVKNVNMDIVPGVQPVRVEYIFDNHYASPTGAAVGPNAIFRVNVTHGSVIKGPLNSINLPLPWTISIYLIDGILLLFLLSISSCYIVLLFPAWRGLLLWSACALVAWWGLPELSFMPIMALAMIWLVLWRGRAKFLVAFTALSILLWFRSLIYLPDPSFGLIRFDGTDMLTYESFAREIFATGSLRAGENVYYYQALFRYVVYLLHLIFGESDMLRSVWVLITLNLGIYLNAAAFKDKFHSRNMGYTLTGWILLVTLVAFANSSVVFLIQHGISELFSWLLIVYLFYLLVLDANRYGVICAALLGLAIINRYNHLPGLLFLFLVFIIPLVKKNKKIAVYSVLIIAVILGVIPLHNWVYGQQLVFMPTTGDTTANLVLPPLKLLSFFSSYSIRSQVFSQSSYLIGLVSWNMLDLCIPIILLLVTWLILGEWIIKKKKSFSINQKWLWLAPAVFLGPQFFYAILANYPRHLFASYLVMALVGMFIAWSPKNSNKEPETLNR